MTEKITISADDVISAGLLTDHVRTAMEQSPTRVRIPTFNPMTNCRNCGAPLNRNRDCEYCGTKHQAKAEIVMNSDGIRWSCG